MRNAQHEKRIGGNDRFCLKSDHFKTFPVIYMSTVFISITHLMSHVKKKKMGKTLYRAFPTEQYKI